MYYTTFNLEDCYLQTLIESKKLVSIYLKNGMRLKGRLTGYSQNVVFLHANITQTIYKNLINSIMIEKEFLSYRAN